MDLHHILYMLFFFFIRVLHTMDRILVRVGEFRQATINSLQAISRTVYQSWPFQLILFLWRLSFRFVASIFPPLLPLVAVLIYVIGLFSGRRLGHFFAEWYGYWTGLWLDELSYACADVLYLPRNTGRTYPEAVAFSRCWGEKSGVAEQIEIWQYWYDAKKTLWGLLFLTLFVLFLSTISYFHARRERRDFDNGQQGSTEGSATRTTTSTQTQTDQIATEPNTFGSIESSKELIVHDAGTQTEQQPEKTIDEKPKTGKKKMAISSDPDHLCGCRLSDEDCGSAYCAYEEQVAKMAWQQRKIKALEVELASTPRYLEQENDYLESLLERESRSNATKLEEQRVKIKSLERELASTLSDLEIAEMGTLGEHIDRENERERFLRVPRECEAAVAKLQKELKDTQEKFTNEVAASKATTTEKDDAIQRLEALLVEKQRSIDALRAEAEHQRTTRIVTRADNSTQTVVQAILPDADAELKRANILLDESKEEAERAAASEADSKRQISDLMRHLDEQNISSVTNDQHQINERLEIENSRLQTEALHLKNEAKITQSDISSLRFENDNLKRQVQVLQEAAQTSLQVDPAVYITTAEALRIHNNFEQSWSTERDSLMAQKNSLIQEGQKLQTSFEQFRRAHGNVLLERDNARMELKRRDKDLAVKSVEVDDIREDLQARNAAVAKLSEQVKAKKAIIDQMSRDMKELTDARDEAIQRYLNLGGNAYPGATESADGTATAATSSSESGVDPYSSVHVYRQTGQRNASDAEGKDEAEGNKLSELDSELLGSDDEDEKDFGWTGYAELAEPETAEDLINRYMNEQVAVEEKQNQKIAEAINWFDNEFPKPPSAASAPPAEATTFPASNPYATVTTPSHTVVTGIDTTPPSVAALVGQGSSPAGPATGVARPASPMSEEDEIDYS